MEMHIARFAVFSLAGLAFFAGCGSSNEDAAPDSATVENEQPAHDPHDVPLTEEQKDALRQGVTGYADAIAKIKSYRDRIRDAVAAGNPPDAHRPLDELDVILEYMPTVARDTNVARTDWERVNTSAQQLRERFDQVHAQIDAGEQPNYDAVSADVDAAISRLESISASQ